MMGLGGRYWVFFVLFLPIFYNLNIFRQKKWVKILIRRSESVCVAQL